MHARAPAPPLELVHAVCLRPVRPQRRFLSHNRAGHTSTVYCVQLNSTIGIHCPGVQSLALLPKPLPRRFAEQARAIGAPPPAAAAPAVAAAAAAQAERAVDRAAADARADAARSQLRGLVAATRAAQQQDAEVGTTGNDLK